MTKQPNDPESMLSQFLKQNEGAKLINGAIELPWGDDSVSLKPKAEEGWGSLAEALDAVYLPPRFTALYHRDTRDLEFIYGYVPEEADLRERKFSFLFCGHEYRCEWADASERLRVIAAAFRPSGPPGLTNYRNLHSLNPWAKRRKTDTLLSFWLRDIVWEENGLTQLAQHVNFYMCSFDRESPLIVVHQDPLPAGPRKPNRYPLGTFPNSISAQRLDPNLIGLWETASHGDPLRRFLYYYQILEYASFYYIREETLLKLKKILLAPDLLSKIDDASGQLLDALTDYKLPDHQKLVDVIHRCVDPLLVWSEIQPNLTYFSADVSFDGGFVMPALLKPNATQSEFCHVWPQGFAEDLRQLRNALVHARESRMGGVVTPSNSNRVLMGYWVNPVAVTAMQVMLYHRA